MSDDDAVEVPQIVRPGEAATLVVARADIPVGVAEPVAGWDARGRHTVRVLLHAREQVHLFRIIAAIRSVIEPRPIDAAEPP